MLTWHIVFRVGSAGNLRKDERGYDAAQYAAAAIAKQMDGQEVIGMWVIDGDTEQDDVIKCDGDRVPDDILVRCNEYKARKKPRQP